MLHLKEERKVRLFEITETEGTEIKRTLKTILKKYDDVVSQGAYDIKNCRTIKHTIKLLNKTSIVGKQGHRSLREYEWIEK